MAMEPELELELELESEMYKNCLLLGIDPSIIDNGSLRVGKFRHSNPTLGAQLLYFILSSFRGPKEFANVWPIYDHTQTRDFLKVVQSIISELESQGALPRSNSRVSSLATCCGPRFVELLWQLSLHALREVLRRTYPADVASNPLPASLTDVAFSHASTLLPVTKARIALERRKFLKNAEIAVQRQAMCSNLAHEMTAEYRALCAEEAYLQQELEKLHDLRNKVKMEGEPWDELVSSSSQNSHLVQRATRLWDSLLSRKSQHEVLASGPIEDLIAHREHRYRISGSSLRAAMDESSTQVSSGDPDKEQTERSQMKLNRENVNEVINSSDEKTDRSGRGQPTVDIAEVLRRWTHALQRIHKQLLYLANANDGEGPDLLRSANDGGTSGHAESLAATLAEHQQHLASIQVLVDQLKGVAPVIQNSISELTEEVNSLLTNLPQVTNHHGLSSSPIQAQSTGTTMESSSGEVTDVTSVSSVQVYTNDLENVYENLPNEQIVITNQVNTRETDNENNLIHNLKKSVREAALSTRASSTAQLQDNQSDDGSEHVFVPLSGTGFSRVGPERNPASLRSKQLFASELNDSLVENRVPVEMVNEYDRVNGYILAAASNYEDFEGQSSFFDMVKTQDQVFSPPFLMDASLYAESFEDLLGSTSCPCLTTILVGSGPQVTAYSCNEAPFSYQLMFFL